VVKKPRRRFRTLKGARRQDLKAIEKAEHEVKIESVLVEYWNIKRTKSGRGDLSQHEQLNHLSTTNYLYANK
jgi:hypothetical protein